MCHFEIEIRRLERFLSSISDCFGELKVSPRITDDGQNTLEQYKVLAITRSKPLSTLKVTLGSLKGQTT